MIQVLKVPLNPDQSVNQSPSPHTM